MIGEMTLSNQAGKNNIRPIGREQQNQMLQKNNQASQQAILAGMMGQ